jgi:competence protein ComGC
MTLKKHWLKQFGEEKGLGLVETLVAVAILGTAVVAFVAALSAGSIAVGEYDGEAVAQRLAQSQMEYTKSYTYDPGAVTYPLLNAPAGYVVSVAVNAVPNAGSDIQKITVTVARDGEEWIKVEDYKMDR